MTTRVVKSLLELTSCNYSQIASRPDIAIGVYGGSLPPTSDALFWYTECHGSSVHNGARLAQQRAARDEQDVSCGTMSAARCFVHGADLTENGWGPLVKAKEVAKMMSAR